MVSATEKTENLADEQFDISASGTPKTYRIYMQHPVEVVECWSNLTSKREIDAGVKTTVGKVLGETLFGMINDAFLADGVVVEDESWPSGLRPIRGELRSNGLSKSEKIEVTALKARYIAHLSEQQGSDNISGGHATSDVIPRSVALKVKEAIVKATQMMLSAGKIVGNDDVCRVRMSALLQIDSIKED